MSFKQIQNIFIFGLVLFLPKTALCQTTTFNINRDYGNVQMVSVPQEFDFSIPQSNTNVVTPLKSGDQSSYVKIQFITDDKRVTENITFQYMKIPLDENNDRRIVSAKRFLADILNTYNQATLFEIITTKIGRYEMVFVNAQNGKYYLSLVGILNPNSHHGVAAIINIDPYLSEVKKLDDVTKKGSSLEVLKSFHFGKELM